MANLLAKIKALFAPTAPISWYEFSESEGAASVQTNNIYPELIAAVGLEVNKYSLEVARRCVVTYLKEVFQDELKVVRLESASATMALKNWPGTELDAAAGAADFRQFYETARVFLAAKY